MFTLPEAPPTVLSQGSDDRARSVSLNDSKAIQLEERLQEALREKESLRNEIQANEEKVMNNDISVCIAESNFIE